MASSGLAELAADLRHAGDEVGRKVTMAVRKSGRRTERLWRMNARLTARQHGKHYPGAVTHDVAFVGDWVTAEVGPDKGRKQGPLGNLLEFGSRNNPPHKDGQRALAAERPRFYRDMDKAGEIEL